LLAGLAAASFTLTLPNLSQQLTGSSSLTSLCRHGIASVRLMAAMMLVMLHHTSRPLLLAKCAANASSSACLLMSI
jgi:hypothetical protein